MFCTHIFLFFYGSLDCCRCRWCCRKMMLRLRTFFCWIIIQNERRAHSNTHTHTQPNSSTLKDFPPIIYETPDGHFVLLIGWLWLITTLYFLFVRLSRARYLFRYSHSRKPIAKYKSMQLNILRNLFTWKKSQSVFELSQTEKYMRSVCTHSDTHHGLKSVQFVLYHHRFSAHIWFIELNEGWNWKTKQ